MSAGRGATTMTPLAIVVHGGAGAIAPERHARVADGCAAAAEIGYAILAAGGRALDAVQAAVRALEDDPELNAGTGAVLNRDGTVELDACLMDGATLAIGGVAAAPDLRNPIDVARAVLDDGEHVLLSGYGAQRFAIERGISPVTTDTLITERSRARWWEEHLRRSGLGDAVQVPEPRDATRGGGGALPASPAGEGRERPPGIEGGTVGAVALDAEGHVAAATSTGGINYKRPGRVGDTPLPGCGTWADDAGGAASATGDGEAIIRVTLCRALIDRLARGEDPEAAAAAALDELVRRGRGTGGVIAVDPRGTIVAAHASPTMSFAAIRNERRARGVTTTGASLAALLT